MSDAADVAVLGCGIMGTAMATRMLEADLDVRVWNRSPEATDPLEARGARVADTPTEAVRDTRRFMTALSDADAVREVLEHDGGVLESTAPGTIWLQSSTIGVDDTRALVDRARTHDVAFVDAPVLGTKEPAEAGELTVLAASDPDLRDDCRPVFDAIGRRTTWLEAPPDATSLKLVCNTWVVGLLGTLAETVALAEQLDVDPQLFLDAIEGGPLDAGYAQLKGQMMLSESFEPSFPLEHALKDANLIRRAAEAHDLEVSVVEGVADLLARAVDAGDGELDMAAAVAVLRRAD